MNYRYRWLARKLIGRLSRDPVERALQYLLAAGAAVLLVILAVAWLVSFIWTNKWWFVGAGLLLYVGMRLRRRK